VAKTQAAGRDVRYWQVRNAQHFDAFLALPDYRARYVPLLPYVYAALDRVAAHLDDPSQPLPDSTVIDTAPAAAPLTAAQLAIPARRLRACATGRFCAPAAPGRQSPPLLPGCRI
jgi:hydroxybutyrate-dimer hydrolase